MRDASGCKSEMEVAAIGLKVAEQLTGSKFGLIGEINEAGLFDTIAISDPGWDACKIPHSEVTKLTKDMEIREIDRSTLKEERSRIVNDPSSHPDSVGVPRGHPPITCFLGVPMKQGRKTVGMFGVANKKLPSTWTISTPWRPWRGTSWRCCNASGMRQDCGHIKSVSRR